MADRREKYSAPLLAIVACLILLEFAPCDAIAQPAERRESTRLYLCRSAVAGEQSAARELSTYLNHITGNSFSISEEPLTASPGIYIGATRFAKDHGLDPSNWGPERWAIRTADKSLILVGGRPRGTLYAVYHFLEEIAGVRWWNPFEVHVPHRPVLEIGALDRGGEPAFSYREIYQLYANDNGRFAARNRLNGQDSKPIDPAFGSGVYYGPPSSVHTFNWYVPATEFKQHPEWFSLVKGRRTATDAQLCLTNVEMRTAVVERLARYIEQSRREARRAGRPPPIDFEISQNDCAGMCQCPRCHVVAVREGSEAGPLLDFINWVADSVREKYPEVRVNTLAYQATDKPPRNIRPRDNVVIRLCDTNANLLQPITHADNQPFAERLVAWGRIAKNLRVWDYGITFSSYPGIPLPSMHTYATDYQFYRQHRVEGVFTEFENPITADLRDLKVWMMMKLLEDPSRDKDALLRDFTDGFYGPAGATVRRYVQELEMAANAAGSRVDWFPALSQYDYLTVPFLCRAQAIFDEAETLVNDDKILLRRVRHARMPVDRACLALWGKLMRQWVAGGGKPEAIPLDRAAIGRRCRETWYAQIELRTPRDQQAMQRVEADRELVPLLARRSYVKLPAMFQGYAGGQIFDFTAEEASLKSPRLERVADEDADCGITNRWEFTDAEIVANKPPLPWGATDPTLGRGLGSTGIKATDIAGPGYQWYKLASVRVTPSSYVYFFWSWILQVPLHAAFNASRPDQHFDAWAHIRFDGPAFPYGKVGEKNAISVERLILVPKKPQ